MKPPKSDDPKEQAFVEAALAAATRAQRWEKARIIVTTTVLVAAATWFASRPPGPELRIEVTILIMVGAMIGVVTAKLRSLIQRNTMLVLQAIADLRPQGGSVPPQPGPGK